MDMDIVKNVRDLSLNEDEQFFAELITEEFGCYSCVEKIKNKDFLRQNVRPVNDFNIYTTAQPTVEGIRLVSWRPPSARRA